MSLSAGSRLGPYEIQSAIGAGGMGEVYRARDTRLKRDVAIKVLPELFAAESDRLARFRREAQLLASLNHPNIAAIYGFEEADGVHALVLELVEGPTLADRVTQSPVPLDEALVIARQIVDALEAAHEQGIVHRDLKPANIKVRTDGAVKVLDFGLAKAFEGEPVLTGASFSLAPTITSPAATGLGVILGTAAYMSPEQARGKTVDKRSDVWAFGCVLYEMLTGRRAFEGENVADVLARVIERDADFGVLPAGTPHAIHRLLHRTLQKDRKRRLSDIADARLEIDDALAGPVENPLPGMTGGRIRRERAVWIVAIVLTGIVAVTAGANLRRIPVDPPELRLQIATPPGNPAHFAISPDGRQVVFEGARGGESQLWLRPFDSDEARALPDTKNAIYPFWAPDGRSVGFFADQKLKRIDVAGGVARGLADAIYPGNGGTWSPNGVVLFVPGNGSALYRVPAEGGTPIAVTRLDPPRQLAHRFPQFLPDGRHFLYWVSGVSELNGINVGDIESATTRKLLDADMMAGFAPPDYVLYVRQDTLFAQRFNFDTFDPIGKPSLIAERVEQDAVFITRAAVSASAGTIGYRRAPIVRRHVIWLDRAGRHLRTVGEFDTESSVMGDEVRMSPDGGTIGIRRRVNGQSDVWLMDATRGILRRFTSDAADDSTPVWSADGTRIAFESNRRGIRDLYERSTSGVDADRPLVESSDSKNLYDWSHDGRFVLYSNLSPDTARDLWALPLKGDRKPFPVVQSRYEESWGSFSPDGHWLAYQSDETGRNEVYVRPFPGPGSSTQVSIAGGSRPQWRGDQREVFYIAPDGRLMAVPIALRSEHGAVAVGSAAALFPLSPNAAYVAAADGERFLVNTPLESDQIPPITVLLNWAGGRRSQ